MRSVHIVTRGLLPVAAGEQPDASAAAVLGLVRCAPHDLPGVTAHLVDLDPTPGLRPEAADDLDALVTEILAPSPEDVALRAGHRYTVRYEPAPADRPSPVRRGGVYLLLGGNGRIGAAAARALSEEAPCTLVLAGLRRAGRPRPNTRRSWPRWPRWAPPSRNSSWTSPTRPPSGPPSPRSSHGTDAWTGCCTSPGTPTPASSVN